MSDKFQHFNSPLGQSLGENTKYLELIGCVTNFPNETNIFTEILGVLDVENLGLSPFSSIVNCLGNWDKNVGNIVHGLAIEENVRNIDKKDFLQKHGIHYMIQRARRDMDQLIDTLDQLRIAVGNANEEFERENNSNNISNNNITMTTIPMTLTRVENKFLFLEMKKAK